MKSKYIVISLLIITLISFLFGCNPGRDPGLYYTLQNDGTYSVTNCSDIFFEHSTDLIKTTLSGEVIIPSSYNGFPVTKIGDRAFQLWNNMTSLTIPDTVTSIGEEAFLNCSGLINLVIPDSVTDIGHSAFYECTGLQSVKLPFMLLRINHFTFIRCSGLDEIDIPDSVNEIGAYAFAYCTSLERIFISENVSVMQHCVFQGCNNIKIYIEASEVPEGWHENWLENTTAQIIYNAKTISFNSMGGSIIPKIYGRAGDTVILPSGGVTPTKEGFEFSGWFSIDNDTDGNGIYEADEGDTLSESPFDLTTAAIPSDSITLFAKWVG